MREYFRGLKFILVIIVIAFVATSVVYFRTGNTGGGPKSNVVATVNGEDIPAERFRRTQANLIARTSR
jgi:SurA N-terminal domain